MAAVRAVLLNELATENRLRREVVTATVQHRPHPRASTGTSLAVTVSLFGWFVALRGLLLLANPAAIESGVDATVLSPTATTLTRVFFGALAVAGLVLTYAGWFTKPARIAPSDLTQPAD
jgi:hypothetical protein